MEFQGELRHNEKRAAFLDYADLPTRTSTPLELALCLAPGDEEDVRFLERGGWSIRHAWTVSSGPEQYRAYIQRSRGEFSVVKPSCVWLGNAWISDRTLCYLASAKPAVVQHTGPSRFLPDSEGLFRFRNMEEATRALTAVESDHERHRRLARELAEEHFVRSESRWTRAGAGAGMRGPRSCQSLAILGYHKIGEPPAGGWRTWFYVPEEIFVGHLGYLREHGWQVIDLPALLSGITAPESLPERAALLTFDDGYRSTRTVALPWLLRFGYPAVLFVPTDYIGGSNGFDAGCEPEEAICDWDDLAELERSGVSIQSHGASHRPFSKLSLPEQEEELGRSKLALEASLEKLVEVFSYPYGDGGTEPVSTCRALERAGYRAACLYDGGPNPLPIGAVYHLARLAVGPDTDLRVALERG